MIIVWDEERDLETKETVNLEELHKLRDIKVDDNRDYCIPWVEYVKLEMIRNDKLNNNTLDKKKKLNLKIFISIIGELDKKLPIYICKDNDAKESKTVFTVDSRDKTSIIRAVVYLKQEDDIEVAITYWKQILGHYPTSINTEIRVTQDMTQNKRKVTSNILTAKGSNILVITDYRYIIGTAGINIDNNLNLEEINILKLTSLPDLGETLFEQKKMELLRLSKEANR